LNDIYHSRGNIRGSVKRKLTAPRQHPRIELLRKKAAFLPQEGLSLQRDSRGKCSSIAIAPALQSITRLDSGVDCSHGHRMHPRKAQAPVGRCVAVVRREVS
jgi:hypothetical protein